MDLSDKITLPLGLGTSKLRSLDGGISARSAARLLESAFDSGIRFVDTAPSYGQGQAEAAIGRLPERIKDQMIICSKAGYLYGRKALLINALKPLLQPATKALPMIRGLVVKSRDRAQHVGSLNLDIQPSTIRHSLAATLRRLRRGRLDVLLLHDPSIDSLGAENQGVLAELKQEGLIGSWGLSTDDPAVAHRALEIEQLRVLQVPLEPAWVEAAGDLFSKCHAAGVFVIANRVLAPLQSESGRPAGDRQQQIEQCFGYALSQPGVQMVLCGSTQSAHVKANVESMHSVLQSA